MRIGCSGARSSVSCSCSAARLSSSVSRRPVAPGGRALRRAAGVERGLAQRGKRRGEAAVQLAREFARRLRPGIGGVDLHELRVLAKAPAEAQAEVHRHAHHERDIGVLQRGAAGARVEVGMVRRQAAAREAVQEHGDAERLRELAQRVLAVAPVEVGAGHDHGPLRGAEQRADALDLAAVGGGQRARVGQRRRLPPGRPPP